MATVTLDSDQLVVDIDGLDRFWALKSRIEVPLTHVRGASADPGIVREWKGGRVGGTHIPGLIVAGTFHADGERVFWDVHNADRAIVIELTGGESFRRLVIEVDDPRATVATINRAVASRAHHPPQ